MTMSEMMPGTVTLADLFRVLSAMQADMAKVATRLEVIDSRNKNADEIHRDHEMRLRKLEEADVSTDDFRDHERRVRGLEAFRWKLVGAALSCGGLSGAVAALAVWALSRHA